MANRQSAPVQRTMTRSRKILALVPKYGAKSDIESSDSSEDEVKMCRPYQNVSNGSSPVRSITSSVENINISSRNEYGILSLGTVRTNRLRGAEKVLPSDKELKKKGRGSFAQVVSNEHNIAVVKWFDNKFVVAASTYVGAHPVQNIMRYKKEEKKKGPVTCPMLIKHYNINMGGVDLADMLIALYRTDLKGHRWYLALFSQILDICVINAWLMYRHENRGKQKLMLLKKFRFALFRQLRFFERSSANLQPDVLSKSVTKVKKPVAERPDDATRYDLTGHLPTFTTKGRCRNCTKNQTKFFCQKCNARLCLVEGRNCFMAFHTK